MYLKGYASMGECWAAWQRTSFFYNGERPYQSLGQKTPKVLYRTAMGGGAMIVDKFPRLVEETITPEVQEKTKAKARPGQRRPAAIELECAA